MRKVLTFALFIFLSLVLSCNWNPFDPDDIDDDTDTTETCLEPVVPEPHDNLNMFPLSLGNSYTYQVNFYDYNNNPDSTTQTYSIINQKYFSGKEYFMFDNPLTYFYSLSNRNAINYDSLYIRINDYGDIMIRYEDKDYPYIIFDESLEDSIVHLPINDIQHYMIIQSTNDTIITRDTTYYNCFMVQTCTYDIMGTAYFIWFAPDIGPVKFKYLELNKEYMLQ